MPKGIFNIPEPINEPVKTYAPHTAERSALQHTLQALNNQQLDIPMYIGGLHVRSGKTIPITPPHQHQHIIGYFHQSEKEHVRQAIEAALLAKSSWEALSWEHRAAIFLKAAELIAGPYRAKLNAVTMLAQSKNVYQAEIDAACEMVDFLRFNVKYMEQIYAEQPAVNASGVWNRTEYRPLEGFIYALTPFNFTAIAGNLPTSCAMMGNVVVWKPANTQVYSAHVLMEVFRKAGVPDGVINLIYPTGADAAEEIFNHPDFAGIHFTGSTEVFQYIWKTIGNQIHRYKSYPRIVGETGGKDFLLAHASAEANVVATALARGAFEYQGQKCSAVSRAYIAANIWEDVKKYLLADIATFKMGDVQDFSNFINAVIDEKSFDKLVDYIEKVKKDDEAEIIAGGTYDKSIGYFVAPTVIQTTQPNYITLSEELFGPILTVYVYEPNEYDDVLRLIDQTSIYALTGAIVAQDRYAIEKATQQLRNAAGNFYINDKPTGAVVGQQPFGGARKSGTNDKAGAKINLLRWVSPRTIKETFVPAVDYRYPFLLDDTGIN